MVSAKAAFSVFSGPGKRSGPFLQFLFQFLRHGLLLRNLLLQSWQTFLLLGQAGLHLIAFRNRLVHGLFLICNGLGFRILERFLHGLLPVGDFLPFILPLLQFGLVISLLGLGKSKFAILLPGRKIVLRITLQIGDFLTRGIVPQACPRQGPTDRKTGAIGGKRKAFYGHSHVHGLEQGALLELPSPDSRVIRPRKEDVRIGGMKDQVTDDGGMAL